MSNIIEIDPTVDFACKLVIGNPELPELTIHFINAVLMPVVPIQSVEILNPINDREFESDKLSILDIRATDQLERIFNIEIQRTSPDGLTKRLTYYAALNFVDQLSDGQGYHLLRPSITICILTVVLFNSRDRPAFQHAFRLRTKDGFEFTDGLEIHTIELPKYLSSGDNSRYRSQLEQWIYFFLNAKGSSAEQLRRELVDSIFDKAIGVLEMIQRTPDKRRQYDDRIKLERDEQARLLAATEEGKAKEKINTIRMLQALLQIEPTSMDELQSLSAELLDVRISELQSQLRRRIV